MPAPRKVVVVRYVTPLREGGSLPALVEGDDDGLYVLKFRGAGHGALALTAELVAGELARALGLPVPEIVLADLDRDLARTEPDPEIHALIYDSGGVNVALKIISLEGSEGLKEFRAIGLVKRLNNPNLVPLHGYWLKDEFGGHLEKPAGT